MPLNDLNQLVSLANFASGSNGIFRADLPVDEEPVSLTLMRIDGDDVLEWSGSGYTL